MTLGCRRVVLREQDAVGGLRDDARPVPAQVRGAHGRPALHTRPAGRGLLVCCYPLRPR